MRGGARNGAGRKPGPEKVKVGLKLSTWVRDWLKKQANQSEAVEEALINYNNLKKP